jgi:putative membrane protein
MNQHFRWAFALALAPLAACSSSPAQMVTPVAPPAPPPLASVDQTFVMAAASTDAAEIQAANLAETKSHSPRVKAFAAKMITDHTATTQQLTTIAQSKGVTLSPTPDAMQQQMEAKLEADKTSREFDRDYARGQVAAHQAAIKTFQTEIDNGQDPDLKAFAQSTMPTLKQHLMMAERLPRG